MKYAFLGFLTLLSACGTSKYPSLATVPDLVDVSQNMTQCEQSKNEMLEQNQLMEQCDVKS